MEFYRYPNWEWENRTWTYDLEYIDPDKNAYGHIWQENHIKIIEDITPLIPEYFLLFKEFNPKDHSIIKPALN
jgi:hypothetical protein